ncbi:MAG: alpha/beta hydrolase [Clostridia bacterium]|nr:alpha/beta hydrolase [Clostridia bacterium]
MKIEKIKSKKDSLEIELAISEPVVGEARGIVQISHGMAEHKERYFDFMQYLSSKGYICVIHDHRGHGASIKEINDLGYFYTEDISYIVDDLYQVTEYITSKYKNLNVYIFSHSMGTLVSRNYLKKYDDKIQKIILCGPPTENKLAGVGVFFAKLIKTLKGEKYRSKFLNTLTFGSYNTKHKIENGWICSNEKVVEGYNKDNLCGYIFTTNGFINLFKIMKEVYNRSFWQVKNKHMPIFIIAGKDDKVIQNEKKFEHLKSFLHYIGYTNIESKLYEGKKHELINEDNHMEVYNDILNFIEK